MTERPGGRALTALMVALTLFALASPLVKWLIQEGDRLQFVYPDSISFCNVLFVGNACAAVATLFLVSPRVLTRSLREARWATRGLVLLNVAFAVVIPSLLFTALQTTTVTNLVLLGRFESIALAGFAWLFFRDRLSGLTAAGYGVIGVGVVVIAIVEGMGMFRRGDALIVVAATLQGLAACSTQVLLRDFDVRAFVFVRNLGSSIVFFVVATWLFGLEHFADAFRPSLWVVMAIYGLIVVSLAQVLWYTSLRAAPPSFVARWSLLTPILALLFAYLLLGEVPGPRQIVGGAIIAIGIILVRRGTRNKPTPTTSPPVETTLAAT